MKGLKYVLVGMGLLLFIIIAGAVVMIIKGGA